jgi:glycosyltransferase involved in cell wall biosynthesis
MNVPEVSICLTTYNRANDLPATIESILNQTFTDWELIICDDFSSDNTFDIVQKYICSDSRIRYFRNSENKKMPGNLNVAITLCRGYFVANIHDGDYYEFTLVEKWLDLLKHNDNVGMVFNAYKYFYNNGRDKIIRHDLNRINEGRVLFDYLSTTFSSAPWGTVMVPKRVYDEMGLFDHNFGFISDVEMWLRISTKYKIGYIDEPLIHLKQREIYHKYYFPNADVFRLNFDLIIKYKGILGDSRYYFYLFTALKEMISSCIVLIRYQKIKEVIRFVQFYLIMVKGK